MRAAAKIAVNIAAAFWTLVPFMNSSPAAVPGPVPLLERTRMLERSLEGGSLNQASRLELAEIYYLTSRCGDVRKLLLGKSDSSAAALVCACEGPCDEGINSKSYAGRVFAFERLLSKRHSLEDPDVKRTWNDLRAYPEARYRMLRYLRAGRGPLSPAQKSLRAELEDSLSELGRDEP